MLVKNKKQVLRGDTLIEVLFAVAIFAMVAISVTTLMNSMLGKSQSSIEIVMARSEIDDQAEAIRFIHSSKKNAIMDAVWKKIDSKALNSKDTFHYDVNDFLLKNVSSCDEFTANGTIHNRAFYIDTFEFGNVVPGESPSTTAGRIFQTNITTTSTFPRVLHTASLYGDNISMNFDETTPHQKAEGIWVIAVRDGADAAHAEHYDFYIQTCWSGVNSSVPTTINTIIRLRNPTVSYIVPVAPLWSSFGEKA